MSSDPLVIEFDVAVPPAHAFDVWTKRCTTWWPSAHTISGQPAAITFEPRSGGRIVERGRDGTEHVWGTVLDWQRPTRLRYAWHLFFDPTEATEIEITFTEFARGTAIRLEQRGWEQLGDAGAPRRDRTLHVWQSLTGRFAAAFESP